MEYLSIKELFNQREIHNTEMSNFSTVENLIFHTRKRDSIDHQIQLRHKRAGTDWAPGQPIKDDP